MVEHYPCKIVACVRFTALVSSSFIDLYSIIGPVPLYEGKKRALTLQVFLTLRDCSGCENYKDSEMGYGLMA